MTTLCTNICLMPFTPLVNSRIDNVLDRIAPELNQSLFQFISAIDVSLINTLLHLIVKWNKVWAVQEATNPAEQNLASLCVAV